MPQKKPLTSSESSKNQDQADEIRPPAETKPIADKKKEIGGPAGPEPTRFGDWEKAGRCIDF